MIPAVHSIARHARQQGDLLLVLSFVAAYAGVGMVGMADRAPSALVMAASLVLAAGLIALSVIDVRTYRLPDVLTFALGLAALAFGRAFGWPLEWQLISAGAGFAALWTVARVYRLLRGREGLGQGDAKLLAVAGAWLGLEALPTVLLAAAVSALGWTLVRAVRVRAYDDGEWIAFGPFLAAGLWLVWTHGSI